MIKGTTPELCFNLPFSTSRIKSAEIVLQYVDKNKTVNIERNLDECKVGEKSISTVLTQEETLALPAPATAHTQIRVLTNDDMVYASRIFAVSVKRLLKECVLE